MAYGFIGIMGWGIFWVSLVIAIILFAKYRKVHPVFYLISVALYVYTAGYVIDIFELKEGGILTILAISAVIFMILGYYLSKVIDLD